MTKIVRNLITARVLSLLLFSLLYLNSNAQCPFQIKDCKGKCPRFTDLNHDSFCDYTIITKPPVVDTFIIKKDTQSNKLLKSAENKIHPKNEFILNQSIATQSKSIQNRKEKSVGENLKSSSVQHITSIIPKESNKNQGTIATQKKYFRPPAVSLYKRYSLFLISGLCIGLYLISFLLAKFKVIEIRVHRKIWNILLCITFLVTGFLGLFMVIQLNYSIQVKWFKPLLIWHVSFGIGMAFISIFHFLWHWKYVKKIFNFRPVKSNN